MSWKDYVEKQLIATEGVKEACILSADDGALWASHPESFVPRAYLAMVTGEDEKEKEELVNEAADLAQLGKTLRKPKAGLRINHNKYLIVRAMERGSMDDGLKTIYFKKAAGGGCMCVTNQAIIIGTFDEAAGQSSTHCNIAVETWLGTSKKTGSRRELPRTKMADYFISETMMIHNNVLEDGLLSDEPKKADKIKL